MYVKDSNDFRSFEDDLITAERWQDKEAVLREIGAPSWVASSNGPANRVKRLGAVHSLAFFRRLHTGIDDVYRRTPTLRYPNTRIERAFPRVFRASRVGR